MRTSRKSLPPVLPAPTLLSALDPSLTTGFSFGARTLPIVPWKSPSDCQALNLTLWGLEEMKDISRLDFILSH